MSDGGAAPPVFSVRAGLALLVLGAGLFLALLWMIGTGRGFDDIINDGGGHAGGKGLNGFAGLARLAKADGWDTVLARNDATLGQPGLLVLTPEADTPARDIARIVDRHRRIGPVLLILPKWLVQPVNPLSPDGHRGWVDLSGARAPNWPGFLDGISVAILHGANHGANGRVLHWRGGALTGPLPDGGPIEAGSGVDDAGRPLIPLVRIDNGAGAAPGPVLAAYIGAAPMSGGASAIRAEPSARYPLVLVFEPDLLNNFGQASEANAALAIRMLDALAPGIPREVTFDLTLDGLGHAPNLLTLAFTPPYLAATLCLILAALAAGWRSFARFGAARAGAREIAFGKERLVANAGALILRARRLHLLGPPYVAAARERIARALALPRGADPAQTDAAIDRALAARAGPAPLSTEPPRGFAKTVQSMETAKGETAIVAAARALHQLERALTR